VASSVAAAAAMGTVAIPEMRRFNYAPKLAVGVVAAGGRSVFSFHLLWVS